MKAVKLQLATRTLLNPAAVQWDKVPVEEVRLAGGELDRVGSRGEDLLHRPGHVLDAREEVRRVEDAVVEGDVEAAAVIGEEPAEAWPHAHAAAPAGFVSGAAGA